MTFVAGSTQARLCGRMGGLTTAARGTGDTATGRAAARARFDAYADPRAAETVAMLTLALLSARVRRGERPTPRRPIPIRSSRRGFRPLVLTGGTGTAA